MVGNLLIAQIAAWKKVNPLVAQVERAPAGMCWQLICTF
jgi:hypothetical protein